MAEQDDAILIEQLHARDMAASGASDFDVLRTLMDDDAVVLAPGALPLRGREAIDASFAKARESMRGIEVLDYRLEFEEVQIAGDYAFEWGRISGSMRLPDGTVAPSTYNVMRVLRRQTDGTWRVYRTMWNARP